MPLFSPQQLTTIAHDVFVAAGAEPDEARIVAEHLVDSNLAGHDSHGVLRIPEYVDWMEAGDVAIGQHITVMHETDSLAVIEGGWGFGQVIGLEAFDLAIRKARSAGICIVAVSQCGHIGRVGHYPEIAAQQGLVTVLFVNTHGAGKLAAPWGGRGPPPLRQPDLRGRPKKKCRAARARHVDLGYRRGQTEGCSQSRRLGAARLHRRRRRQPPPPTPAAFYGPPQGALLPFGQHKGFGLAFVIDILAGALSGAGCSRDSATRIGNSFLAFLIRPDHLRDNAGFFADVEALVHHVKNSDLAAGFDEILAPGEPEVRTRLQRTRDGIPRRRQRLGQNLRRRPAATASTSRKNSRDKPCACPHSRDPAL